VDTAGGVRLDPIQFEEDIANKYGHSVWQVATLDDVKPSEVYLDGRAMADAGVTPDEIAAGFAAYRYGQNIGPYIARGAVDFDRLRVKEFAGVFPRSFITSLSEDSARTYGAGEYPDADPGIPELG
jgi:hypothetical protein